LEGNSKFVKKRIVRISIGVLIGMFVLAGVIWLLSLTLGDHETLYAGKSPYGWMQQLDSHDVGASNQAYEALNAQVIPRLVDQMFHDTNDSKLRLSLIEALNSIPGVQINFTESGGRRSLAANYLGSFGPPAKAAVPFLIRALKGSDVGLHEPAIKALGQIHSDPGVVIPLLIPYLTNDNLNDEAASALGNYGSLAKEAFPEIVPLLNAKDRDARAAARVALKKIDPEAAAKAGVK
jgi:HEAT repeat protein